MNSETGFDRRQFLMLAGEVLIGAHLAFGGTVQASMSGNRRSRIASLDLLSSAPSDDMRAFYGDLLGLSAKRAEKDLLSVLVGDSQLNFRESSAGTERPFYHFAFNIPENKIKTALEWQKRRTSMLPIPERLRDPDFPPEVVDYSHWNAHSIFFLDPAGNVVEYIARHDLKNAAPGDFGCADILYLSEIGIIVDDVISTASALKEAAGLDQYRGGDDHFTALGDEHGLLLVMKRGRILNFNPATQDKAARIYATGVRARGLKSARYVPGNLPYEVIFDADH